MMVISVTQGPMDIVIPDSKKGFPTKVPLMLLQSYEKMGCLILRLNDEIVVISLPKANCSKCGRNHNGKCLADIDGFFSCGKSCHKLRECQCLWINKRGKERYHCLYGLPCSYEKPILCSLD